MNIEIINTTTDQPDVQAIREPEFPRPAVLGIASGIFLMAFFGAYWGLTSAVFMLSPFMASLPIAGPSPYNWSLFVGIGTTLILWLTAIYISKLGFRVMRRSNA